MSKIEENNISIIIPSYKSEKYIADVLRAINSQTLQPFEVLIIDYKTSNKLLDIPSLYDGKMIQSERAMKGLTSSFAPKYSIIF